jgi:hypothetical protein
MSLLSDGNEQIGSSSKAWEGVRAAVSFATGT